MCNVPVDQPTTDVLGPTETRTHVYIPLIQIPPYIKNSVCLSFGQATTSTYILFCWRLTGNYFGARREVPSRSPTPYAFV